ncbi:N-formylglutamate amidohydrolase [Chryseolinea sp. T2]|uniref:N-formylglutamate amidohydrolase n=1 Tax=Chryseolinea sp. T2 TaxID=3129255 RepID=UPI00307746E4
MNKYIPVITCEHAGNNVPERFIHFFSSATEQLESHLGWDPGAREIGAFLSQQLKAPFYKCESTRLLVEPNRSLNSESLFSKYVQQLTNEEREEVLNQYYFPHRSAVEDWVRLSPKPILHISVHSFTPVFNGVVRDVDIGLLFDPDRAQENRFCVAWLDGLQDTVQDLRCRFNEPYKGTDDGFTTYLRTKFPDDEYLGIEIEINQKFVGTYDMDRVTSALLNTLRNALAAESR